MNRKQERKNIERDRAEGILVRRINWPLSRRGRNGFKCGGCGSSVWTVYSQPVNSAHVTLCYQCDKNQRDKGREAVRKEE